MGSAPASLLGVVLGTHLKDHQQLMNYLLGGALLFGACGLVAKSFVRKKVIGEDDRFDMVWRDRLAAIAIGLVGGFIVGLTSVGSGTFFGLTMLFVFPCAPTRSSGPTSCTPPPFSTSLGSATSSPATSTYTPSAGS
jgi:uncharacterized protein